MSLHRLVGVTIQLSSMYPKRVENAILCLLLCCWPVELSLISERERVSEVLYRRGSVHDVVAILVASQILDSQNEMTVSR